MCRNLFIFTLFCCLNCFADIQVQTQHHLQQQASGNFGEYTQIRINDTHATHLIHCVGQARITGLQSNRRGTTIISGHFTGSIGSGNAQLRAPHPNTLFYLVLDGSDKARLKILPKVDEREYQVHANQEWFELRPRTAPDQELVAEPSIPLDENGDPIDPELTPQETETETIVDDTDEDVIEDPNGG